MVCGGRRSDRHLMSIAVATEYKSSLYLWYKSLPLLSMCCGRITRSCHIEASVVAAASVVVETGVQEMLNVVQGLAVIGSPCVGLCILHSHCCHGDSPLYSIYVGGCAV